MQCRENQHTHIAISTIALYPMLEEAYVIVPPNRGNSLGFELSARRSVFQLSLLEWQRQSLAPRF